MPQVYFTTCFDCKDLKEQHKLRKSCESEGQILDAAISSFFSLSVEKKFCGLFKRRYLIAPSSMQRRTPNTSAVEPGHVYRKSSLRTSDEDSFVQPDEVVIRLLPKIFDDASMKNWRNINSNIDTWIALTFLDKYFEP